MIYAYIMPSWMKQFYRLYFKGQKIDNLYVYCHSFGHPVVITGHHVLRGGEMSFKTFLTERQWDSWVK